MKIEVLILIALAAALAFHRGGARSACGPSGCLLLAPNFQQSVEEVQPKAATPPDVR